MVAVVTAFLLSALVTQATSYRIDPATAEAGFDVKATAHTVHGSTPSVAGEVSVTPEAADALKLSGKISIGAGALRTGNGRRDATMHGKSLLVASFPTIDFDPERFAPSGPADTGGRVAGVLTGRLTIRGQTRDQAISATLTRSGDQIIASGTFDVAWADFGVPDPSFFIVRIEKVAHARFRATFVPIP